MARAGQTIENPVTGERVVFRKTSTDTGGRYLEVDLHVRARGLGAGQLEHIHTRQEERFVLTAGELTFRLEGRERVARVGDVVVIPAGTRHSWWNASDGAAQADLTLTPALNFESVLETMFGLARDGKLDRNNRPSLLQLAVLSASADGYLPGPPIWLQRIAMRTLAYVGRALGYRERYARYSDG